MFIDKSVKDFIDVAASNEPVPGGGGVSALVGALGISLGEMVGNLTVGKKKYADVEDEILEVLEETKMLRQELLRLVDLDAEVFEPISKAYGIPKDDPKREEIMEEALKGGASVPMEIVKTCGKALDLIRVFADKGSRLAVSDAGCAASLCGSAMESAALNVLINTKAMKDRVLAESINEELEELLGEYLPKAREIYREVSEGLWQKY